MPTPDQIAATIAALFADIPDDDLPARVAVLNAVRREILRHQDLMRRRRDRWGVSDDQIAFTAANEEAS